MRVIVTCGGTGGHITPALAIADIILENEPRAKLLFVGGERGMEGEIVTNAGHEIRLLAVQGLSRKLSLSNLKALYSTHRAVKRAREILLEFAPDIVIGTGGYACYPALRAACDLGIATAVHESNAIPGLAVRALARRLDRVWLNFEEARGALPRGCNVLVVGNPLPRGYTAPVPASLPKGMRCFLLSFGGSLGASELNRAALALMERIAGHPDIFYLHAAGKRAYEEMYSQFQARGLDVYANLSLVPYITQMPRYMAAADLVICRAGAMSVCELAALGRPAVLVPSPNVTGNHQYKNAMAPAARGGAILLPEHELFRLGDEVFFLLSDEKKRREMGERMRELYRPDANAKIWRDIQKMIDR